MNKKINMVVAKKQHALFIWQLKAKEGGECGRCHKRFEKLTVDHIIPILIVDMLDDTGRAKFEDEENFELVCWPCNSFKNGRLDKAHPKTKRLLIKYLQ